MMNSVFIWPNIMIYVPWDSGNTPKHIPRHLEISKTILKKSNFDIPEALFWKANLNIP